MISTFHQDSLDEPSEHDLLRWSGALTLLEAFQPRTPVEAMLSAQIISTHHAIMECYHRAMKHDTPEELAVRIRGNAATLTRAMDITLRALERRQARPLPPPLPNVSTSVDALLDRDLDAPVGMPVGTVHPSDGQAPTRPAIVIPQLMPKPPVDQAFMENEVAAVHAKINTRLDRERGGTPQEWYSRQREEVRQRKEAEVAARGKTPDEG
jgi:hypothetical protein